MIVKEIIYNNLFGLLDNLTLGAVFEAYYDAKDENDREKLLELDEGISSAYSDIKKSKLKGDIFTDFENLLTLLAEFKSRFNDYPNNRIVEVSILAKLIQKLNEAIGGIAYDITTEMIDVSGFSLELLKQPIFHKNYYYSDSVVALNSVILIDVSNLPELFEFIDKTALSIDLTSILLAKIGDPGFTLQLEQYVLITNELKGKSAAIYAFVCLHITSAGYYTHKPHLYTTKPSINPKREILPANPYQQFNDSLTIISEYNYHKDILDKYLRLYHLIENFMYKYPLVDLERSHTGTVFSIRDFKRMYDEISNNESSTLKKLIARIFKETFDPGTFFDFIKKSWVDLQSRVSEDDLNKLLALLRVSNGKGSYVVKGIIDDNLSTVYALLVYSYRNSLVHNRETEFHLTHETLINHKIGKTIKEVLETFIIPTLEEISFYLIIKKNEVVWYKGSTLTLWPE